MLGFVVWVSRFFCSFLLAFLFPFGSLLYMSSVLLGTSWFFFYQYITFY